MVNEDLCEDFGSKTSNGSYLKFIHPFCCVQETLRMNLNPEISRVRAIYCL